MEPKAPPTPPAARFDEPPPWTLPLLAAACLVAGLAMLSDGPFAFSAAATVDGIVGELGTTLPAALLVLLASAMNLAAGAVAVRAILGRPLEGIAEAVLGGFLGAVLLDIVLLGALGGTGLFRWPVLVGIHVAILAGGTRLLPIVRVPRPDLAGWAPAWVIVALSWIGLIALQLASPVVPFVDVLPNHVAQVEHLRTFGDFATLTTTASPIYGPSRTFLGYVALLGVVDTLTGLPAALAVAAFALSGAVAVAAGLYRLGTAIGGGQTGTWAVVTFVLTTSFVRLPDARATVLVLPLVCWCLALVAERVRVRRPPKLSEGLLLGAGIAAAVLFHPVIGALAALSVGLVTLALPRQVGHLCAPALAAAAILALPQVATMVELAVPSILALLVIPPAIGAAWLLHRFGRLRRGLITVARIAAVVAMLAVVINLPVVLPAAWTALDRIVPTMPVLLATVLVGLLLAPRRMLSPVVLAMIVAGVIAATATELVPAQGTLLTALRFEVPKTLHYWLPVGFALAAAIALDVVWSDDRLSHVGAAADRALPRLALVAFLVAAIMPLRPEPLTDAYFLGERRLSETVSLQLKTAELGYWRGYPDARGIVDPDQVELLDAVRREIAAGRLGPSSEVLHVARSFQQWAAVPLGVFAGVIETDVTPDAEVSIHTVGGRLRPFAALATELARRPPYVLLEPQDLPPATRDEILAGGYRSIFSNARGELFGRQA